MMYNAPEIMHAFLDHITDSIADYASHQVEPGSQHADSVPIFGYSRCETSMTGPHYD